ncbi:MAG: toll/interleukin-1 receptor domain-containing protein [Hyphomonadaceae bacterium]|nr:toll/interleukin-1 receptor domain-containing protein [Hyphomonadaceae bacterium]
MAEVFLSYAREDAARAQQVAQALGAAGVEVFWDNEIPPGTTWADYIEAKLAQCKALIVLWSEHSTKSQWVREEARLGRDKGVLIPAMIDASQAPFGFGEVQAANLASWTGDGEDPNWKRFVAAVQAAAARERAPAAPAAQPQPLASAPAASAGGGAAARKSIPAWAWAVGGVGALVVATVVIAAIMPRQPAVGPAGPTTMPPPIEVPDPTTNAYQQQILARLGQVEQAFAAQGFQRISEPVSGGLQQGQYANTPVNLQVGGDYRIIGVCDNDCGDLDLVLYDENNNVVSQDNATDATPVVAVTPQWTGAFTAQAVMHNCTVQPCYYALVLYGRPLQ